MSESVPRVKPPEPLEISTGNPAHSWGNWKQKFEIYLKVTAASKKPDEMKVELLLNHMMILREEKRNYRPKIVTSTQLC